MRQGHVTCKYNFKAFSTIYSLFHFIAEEMKIGRCGICKQHSISIPFPTISKFTPYNKQKTSRYTINPMFAHRDNRNETENFRHSQTIIKRNRIKSNQKKKKKRTETQYHKLFHRSREGHRAASGRTICAITPYHRPTDPPNSWPKFIHIDK